MNMHAITPLSSRALAVAVCLGGLLAPGARVEAQGPSSTRASGDDAPPRVVVYPFDGPRRYARRARDVVEEAIASDATLVTVDEVRVAVEDFEIDLARDGAHLELATAVAAPIVILGEASGTGTEVWAVDANGAELGRRSTGSVRTAGGVSALEASARELIVEASLRYETQREAALEAARQAQLEEAREAEIDQELLEEMGVSTEDEDTLSQIPEYPVVQALVGLSFRNRNLTIAREGLMGQPAVDAAYSIGLFPELTLRIEARPLIASGPMPGGFVVWFDGGIGFGVRTETEAPERRELDTTVFHVEAGAGYLYPIEVFQVGVNLGLGFDAYQLEENAVLPTTNYGYLRLGLEGRATILRGVVEPRVFFGYRVVVGVNDELTQTFGSESTLGGFDVGAGVGGQVFEGLTYLLAFEYVRWSMSFTGDPSAAGAVTRGTDGSDDGVRIRLQAGWSF